MLKKLAVIAGLASTPSFGNCWFECTMINPITGKCVAKVRMCDVENPAKAVVDFRDGIYEGLEQLGQEWRNLWGSIPDNMRHFLENYPITLITTIYPDTRAYWAVAATIESYYVRQKDRAKSLDEVIKGAPEWKQKSGYNGYLLLAVYETGRIGAHDFNAEAFDPIGSRFDGVWASFLNCLRGANSPENGTQCVEQLDIGIAKAKLGIQ